MPFSYLASTGGQCGNDRTEIKQGKAHTHIHTCATHTHAHTERHTHACIHHTYSHGPHLDHGPFLLAILLADLRYGMPVGLYSQVEDGIKGFLICSICLCSAACAPPLFICYAWGHESENSLLRGAGARVREGWGIAGGLALGLLSESQSNLWNICGVSQLRTKQRDHRQTCARAASYNENTDKLIEAAQRLPGCKVHQGTGHMAAELLCLHNRRHKVTETTYRTPSRHGRLIRQSSS